MIIKKIRHKDTSGKEQEYDFGADAANIVEDSDHRFVSDAEKESWNNKMESIENPSDMVVNFQPSVNREHLTAGEKLSILFGKVAKWFSDMKDHAFTDLIQNATTADTTRAVSAAVAKNLQDQITVQRNEVRQWFDIYSFGKAAFLNVYNVPVSEVHKKHVGRCAPEINVELLGRTSDGKMCKVVVMGGGYIMISDLNGNSLANSELNLYVSGMWMYEHK